MRKLLRKPKISDLKEFREAFNDKEVSKQLEGYDYPLTIKKAEKVLQDIISKNKAGNYYELAIIFNKNFVGTIVLEKPSKNKKVFTLGYAIGRRYWNKGITTEAIKKMINFGFNSLKLNKIVADNDEDNPASGRVLEKNGFKFIKKVKKRRRKADKKINVLYWERVKLNRRKK